MWRNHIERKLQCHVQKIVYDIETLQGSVFLPNYNCVDMHGTIEVFKALDPEVRRIKVFEDGKPDTMYFRKADGSWKYTDLKHERAGI